MDAPDYNTWVSTPIASELGAILHAGELRNTPGIDSQSMRILGEYALILILTGSCRYADAGGVNRAIGPGNAIVVFPELAHAYGPAQSSGWSHVYATFTGPQFDLLRKARTIDSAHPILELESTGYWRQKMEACLTATINASSIRSLKTVGLFTQLLIEVAARDAEASIDASATRIDAASDMLSQPVDGSWITPMDAARRVGLSYESFRKRFAQERGIPPAKFQNLKRIERARTAIYQGTRSFQEIADELGYCDAFHFSKTFKRLTGESPSDFRRKSKGGQPRS